MIFLYCLAASFGHYLFPHLHVKMICAVKITVPLLRIVSESRAFEIVEAVDEKGRGTSRFWQKSIYFQLLNRDAAVLDILEAIKL